MVLTKQQQATDLLIKTCEGMKLQAYLDSVGIPTIAIGTTRYPNGETVRLGDTCTEEQAYIYLNSHLEEHVYPYVDKICAGNSVADSTYAALCSFVYNEGSCGISILQALHDEDLNELAIAFRKYIYAKGKIAQGLVNRREIEIKYFMEAA